MAFEESWEAFVAWRRAGRNTVVFRIKWESRDWYLWLIALFLVFLNWLKTETQLSWLCGSPLLAEKRLQDPS